MELHRSRYDTSLSNSDWFLNFNFGSLFLKNEVSNETFSLTEPKENINVLEDFLTYFREKLKERGINIKE